ncbi:cryptochrome, DASH family [Idiomarina sp. A28L]|uniref:DASH family cryptochrome n=1 Tax=Idiomarina sp. A28L TaxID=1036674 RepID=UPI0002138C35|nr:DASH family cryptochrome [Idiomarina sp. A28L]EGN74586.1 cryptochrome, DASH family [Idiomarina sp. A28L]
MAITHSNQLVWFRRNLRVANNPALEAAADSQHAKPLGVFCYDQQYTGTWLGMPRCAPLRAKFLWESVQDLQQQLQQMGGELIVQAEEPETLLPKLCQELNITHVHTQRLFAHEEVAAAERVLQALNAIGVTFVQHECYTLLAEAEVYERHTSPLGSFSKFRRKVAPDTQAITLRLNPLSVSQTSAVAQENAVARENAEPQENGVWHQLLAHQKQTPRTRENTAAENIIENAVAQENGARHHSLKQSPIAINADTDSRSVLPFKGGETAGQRRLQDYAASAVGHYKETRNGLIGADYSSKLSPWLNLGCISPAQVLQAVREYEAEHGANASTEWLIVELLWRDFFQFLAAEHGADLFQGSAKALGKVPENTDNDPTFLAWCAGETSNEFVNANMRELAKTGFMSNRGRQNVASALIHDMGIDWRWGALWFEANLLDYDPASNYGNWQYIGGLAANPRGGSWFNLKKQAQMYDTEGAYQKLWQAQY